MQSKQAQVILYSICVFFCFYYAVDGVLEVLSPERSAAMMGALGQAGYYVLTVVRTIVLVATGVAFARVVLNTYNKKDE